MFTPKRKFKLWRGAKRSPKPPVVVVAAAAPKKKLRRRRLKIKRTGATSAKTHAGLTSPAALHKHLDASLHKTLLPVSDVYEPCVTLNNAVRNIHVTTSKLTQYVGIVWTPSGARVLRRGVTTDHADPPVTTQNNFFHFNPVEALNENPAPLMLRASRMSVTIRNVGTAQEVQGVVRVVSAGAPFDLKRTGNWGLHPDSIASMESLFDHHPAVKTITADRLRSAHRVNAHHTALAQSRKYFKHRDWTSSTNSDTQNSNWHAIYEAMAGEMPLEQIWLQFPAMASGVMNSYELVCHFQDAAIYPLDSLGGRMHQKPPAAGAGSPPGTGRPGAPMNVEEGTAKR